MKKIIYNLLSALCCFLAAGSALAQAPDGYHCTGQPYGNLFFRDYPATSTYPGGTEIHGVGAAGVPSFGPRGSMVFLYRSDTYVPTLEATAILLDSLTFSIGGFAEFEFEGGFFGDVMYGEALTYDGPTPVESHIYINATWNWGPMVVKTSQISVTGKYTVETSIGRKIYGLRSGGGNHGAGVFFSINSDGTGYTELYHFLGASERPDHLMLRYEQNENGIDYSQPKEFWGISYAGGSHGKGALIVLSLDGSSVHTRFDFTGYGGADDTWGPTDGEGPIAMLQDIDTDGYIITRSGGANNKGAIFMIGDDGNHKVHDFTNQYGTPTASAVVDKTSKKVFGIGGDEPGNDGFIYSFSLLSDFNFNDHLIDFNNNNDFKHPVSLAPSMEGLLYISVADGNPANGNGAFLSANTDGSNLTKLAEYEDCIATLTNPPDQATNVPTTPTLRAEGASTAMTFQLSEQPDFSDDFISLTIYSGGDEDKVKVTTPLKQSTLYYARVDTDVSFPGPVTSFTTAATNSVIHIFDPLGGETDVSITPLIKISPMAGASSYRLEVSERSDFTGPTTVIKTSATPDIRLDRLKYSQHYYARVKSNLSPQYSYVTDFVTNPPEKYSFVSSPVIRSVNVPVNNLKVTANIVYGATRYTIELNTDPEFLGPGIVKTSTVDNQRTLTFSGLQYNTTYWTRVRTNYPSDWGPQGAFKTIAETSYVTQPADNKTDVSHIPIIKVKAVTGASQYTIEISPTSDFSMYVDSHTTSSTTLEQYSVYLNFGTTYYTRVKTDLADYGPVTKFTTRTADRYAFVSSPVDGATNVAYHNLKVTANEVPGATDYTIELNTSPDFTGISIVKSSPVYNSRTMIFELAPSTTYYNRIRTNLPSDWGSVRSFTTAPAPPPPAENISGESPIVKVYPNPFRLDFTAEVQNIVDERATILILDVTGRQVYGGEIRNNEAKRLGGELPQGMYILQVKTRTSNTIQRLAKK